MSRDVRDSALALFDSLSKGGAVPDTTLTFADQPLHHKPGVDRPEFATFVVGQGGAIRQLDISLPLAGIYAKQDHNAVRAAFVQRRKFLVIFDQLGERIGGFALGGAKDEAWASAKKTQKRPDAERNRDRKYRIALIVVLGITAILLAAGVVAAVTTTSLF
ncbi:uncharacterized protein ACA1_386440 [Acanthamoeba castellanii str. Neff]|uniref:Transmembrane protein n=1 Tax=Acanthamoeba castellanii (strain ATCC 30010 / Neff) TaxID=1257118 RepID=L8HBP7_ACACF|nr:uncharacterized protein ACA1_386440 [Acanthamoeba castellanii str. Neff]ELR21836.1 hypothetical protein ACA1_386440 [Acanthamoeba castellanii str. Neff]